MHTRRTTPGPARTSTPAAQPSARASGAGGVEPASCSWQSIVLSVSDSQVQFGPGEQPGFSISVVSTQSKDCSFNIGPGHLALVIKKGSVRIWSSADCAVGRKSLVATLQRGVPRVVSIDWRRTTSSPGCGGPAQTVPTGTYTAHAVDGRITSVPATFRLA